MKPLLFLVLVTCILGCTRKVNDNPSNTDPFDTSLKTESPNFTNLSYPRLLEFRNKFASNDVSNCYGSWVVKQIGPINTLSDLESIYWLNLSLKYFESSNIFKGYRCAPGLDLKFYFFDSLTNFFKQHPSEVFGMYYGYYQYGVGAADGEYYLDNFKDNFYPDDEFFYIKALLNVKAIEKYFVEKDNIERIRNDLYLIPFIPHFYDLYFKIGPENWKKYFQTNSDNLLRARIGWVDSISNDFPKNERWIFVRSVKSWRSTVANAKTN